MKGSRKAVLFLGDGSDDFGESTLPVCLLEADRQLGGLNYIVVPGLAILHEVGDGDAV